MQNILLCRSSQLVESVLYIQNMHCEWLQLCSWSHTLAAKASHAYSYHRHIQANTISVQCLSILLLDIYNDYS